MFFTTNAPRKMATQEINLSGTEQLWLKVNSLSATLTFLQTGAHPDDETSPALVYLARELGARVVYCCAVRGEGGQNSIGTEKGSALGVLRTKEMEKAARHIPMELYWSNTELEGSIRDFGFSKSAEDTFNHWDKEKLIETLVRAIRETKPNVICPTFLDVNGQHGHHRAVTQATIKAYYLAADPLVFPKHIEQGLTAWQANQLLLPAWGGGGSCYDDETPPPPTHFTLPTDSFLKRWNKNCFQLGEDSRQFHQTQQMGFEFDDDFGVKTPFHIVHGNYQGQCLGKLCSGMPLQLKEWAKQYPDIPQLLQLSLLIEQMMQALSDREVMLQKAVLSQACLHSIVGNVNRYLQAQLDLKQKQLTELIALNSGLTTEVKLPTDMLYSGEVSTVAVSLKNSHCNTIKEVTLCLYDQLGALITMESMGDIKSMAEMNHDIRFFIPEQSLPPYRPHFTTEEGNNSLQCKVTYQVCEVEVVQNITVPPVIIKSSVSISCLQPIRYLNLNGGRTFTSEVLIASHKSGVHNITVHLQAPKGWAVHPSFSEVMLAQDETHNVSFQVTVPDDIVLNKYTLSAFAQSGQTQWHSHFQHIEYPHIEPTGYVINAVQSIQVVDCNVPTAKIGCLLGTTDNYVAQLSTLGLNLDVITNLDLAILDQFNTLLVGSCAFSSVPNYPELGKWIQNGGRLVTFYHRPNDNWFPLGELVIGSPSMRWRSTQADSPVTYLSNNSQILYQPNKLNALTWQGWVKERGLYFIKQWGVEYQPLLRVEDEDGTHYDGILLHGVFNEGDHIHCSLSLGHQLENAIPGAALLIINLLTHKN